MTAAISTKRPQVVADDPLSDTIEQLLGGKVELLPWKVRANEGVPTTSIQAIYTHGHPKLDGALMGQAPTANVIRNSFALLKTNICFSLPANAGGRTGALGSMLR